MASLDMLQARALAATKCVRRIVDDTPVVLRIKHVGTGTTQTPTVVISNTSSTLTLVDGASSSTAIDLSAAAYNTVGEVCDYINGLASWECKTLDALRADASDNMWANGAITPAVINGETVWDILQDTSAIAEYKVRVTYDETVGNLKPAGSHRVILNAFTYYADLTAAANKVRIYECDNSSKAETQVWGATSVDTTVVAYSTYNTSYPFTGLTATEGKDLVLVITGSVIDHASGYLQAEFTRE